MKRLPNTTHHDMNAKIDANLLLCAELIQSHPDLTMENPLGNQLPEMILM